MPTPRKPADRRQNRATRDLAAVPDHHVEARELEPDDDTPEPSSTWLAATRRDWADLWASDLAGYIRPTDLPGVRRLFDWRDELERSRRKSRALRKEAELEPIVLGSKEQMVANPLFAVADRLDDRTLSIETRIVALEDRLALSPKARLGLGVTEQKGHNLAAQNAAIAAALTRASADENDPRTPRRDAAIDAS